MATVQSIERAFAILSVLSTGPLPLTDIANQTMLPKSTVARLLATLEALDVVEREADGWNYGIGPRVDELARPTNADARLIATVQPHLENLTTALGEASGFAVLEGYRVRYVTQVESSSPVQIRDYSGTICPAHVGPSGLCLMSRWPQEELARYLERPLGAWTTQTITDPELIRKRLDRLAEDGYCWVYEEFAEGISSVAAPVRDVAGSPVGAIHVHGPSYRFPAYGRADDIGRLVREAADYIIVRSD